MSATAGDLKAASNDLAAARSAVFVLAAPVKVM
jgi:hypothetical protein